MNLACAIALTLLVTFANISVASPEASPAPDYGCDELDVYFLKLAELTHVNSGYTALTSDPAGVFGLPADVSQTISASLDDLIVELEAIVPPTAAELYHQAFIDQVVWYRDLVSVADFAAHQRIINRDKQLVPAMSRAIFTGQATCGVATWIDAYNHAFGETR